MLEMEDEQTGTKPVRIPFGCAPRLYTKTGLGILSA